MLRWPIYFRPCIMPEGCRAEALVELNDCEASEILRDQGLMMRQQTPESMTSPAAGLDNQFKCGLIAEAITIRIARPKLTPKNFIRGARSAVKAERPLHLLWASGKLRSF